MKLIAISFLNLPKNENTLLKSTYPDIYFNILNEIYENIHLYSKIKTVYIQYTHEVVTNMKYYKLT